jgi:fucose permease
MVVTWRYVTESRSDSAERRIDYAGLALLTLGIVSVLVALDEGPETGFGDPIILGLFVLGAVLLASFMLVERREGEWALVPTSVSQNRRFVLACLSVLLMSSIFFAALLYLPQYFQKGLGYSALGAGAGLLPLMGIFAVTSFTAGSLYDRLGPRLVVGSGAVALAVGIFVLSFIGDNSSYASLVPGMLILGIGVGLFYSSITTVAVTALDPSRSSLAGGIVYMCQIAGGAVGLGINTAIVTSGSSLADGISTAFRVDGVLALIGLVVVLRIRFGTEASTTHGAARRTSRGHHRAHA